MQILSVEFGQEDALLSFEDFKKKGKRLGKQLFALRQNWAHQFAGIPIGEFVKNFYFHANKKGVIYFSFDENHVLWTVYDFGPGDSEGRSVDQVIASIDRSSEKYKHNIPDGPAGAGLGQITSILSGLRLCPGVAASSWFVDTKDRFAYHGLIILDGYGK